MVVDAHAISTLKLILSPQEYNKLIKIIICMFDAVGCGQLFTDGAVA